MEGVTHRFVSARSSSALLSHLAGKCKDGPGHQTRCVLKTHTTCLKRRISAAQRGEEQEQDSKSKIAAVLYLLNTLNKFLRRRGWPS